MSWENFGMIVAWLVLLGAILIPFFLAFFAALRGTPVKRPITQSQTMSDSEHKQVALLKEQVDLLDKNRRESWTSPTYFKK